jgi:thiamine biosynthesis lipoprotein ApbE
LIDPMTSDCITGPTSATVFARTCIVADALTKAVLLGKAAQALRACGARGFVLTAEEAAHHAA